MVISFKYLGSIISSDGSLGKEILIRISKASQVMGCLHALLLNCHNIQLQTRSMDLWSQAYSTDVKHELSYRKHICQLEKFHGKLLRSIMGICCQDRVTNTEVLDKSGFTMCWNSDSSSSAPLDLPCHLHAWIPKAMAAPMVSFCKDRETEDDPRRGTKTALGIISGTAA